MYPVSAHLSQFPLRAFFLCQLPLYFSYSLGRPFASLVLALRFSPAPLRPVCSCNSCSTPFYSALPGQARRSPAPSTRKNKISRALHIPSHRSLPRPSVHAPAGALHPLRLSSAEPLPHRRRRLGFRRRHPGHRRTSHFPLLHRRRRQSSGSPYSHANAGHPADRRRSRNSSGIRREVRTCHLRKHHATVRSASEPVSQESPRNPENIGISRKRMISFE